MNSTPEVAHYWAVGQFGGPIQFEGKADELMLTSLDIELRNGTEQGMYDHLLFYASNW